MVLRSAQKERCAAPERFGRSSAPERFAAGTELCARRRRLFASGRTKARHVRKSEELSRRAPGVLAHRRGLQEVVCLPLSCLPNSL